MPVDIIPYNPENIRTNNITQCLGGGNEQIPGAGPIVQQYYPTGSRDFSSITQFSPSPVPIQESINVDGVNPSNCSLINRCLQFKVIQFQTLFLNSQAPYSPPHAYVGDTQSPSVLDYIPPTITPISTSTLNNSLQLEITDQSNNVYESAYFYNGIISFLGNDTLNNFSLNPSSIEDSNYLSQLAFYESYGPDFNPRWVLKNNNSNHRDWTYIHSSIPNELNFTTFNEDQWWIYDFNESTPQIISKIDIGFVFTDAHRHSHIEISGSNDPNIFSTNPNIENIVGEQWKGIGTLNNGSFPSNGILSTEISNQTSYRWYKLTFKNDGFEDNELHIQNIKFYGSNISTINEVKMSDFYGLFAVQGVASPFQVSSFSPLYNTGYSMVSSSEDNFPQINLGG